LKSAQFSVTTCALHLRALTAIKTSRASRCDARSPANLNRLLVAVVHADALCATRQRVEFRRILPVDHLPYQARAAGVLALDAVWEPLDALDPLAKQALVEGITATISQDNRITVAESELLRTICGVLHCPLPPMLERG